MLVNLGVLKLLSFLLLTFAVPASLLATGLNSSECRSQIAGKPLRHRVEFGQVVNGAPKSGVFYKGQNNKGIAAKEVAFGSGTTVRFFPRSGEFPENSEVVLELFSGVGAPWSHGGSYLRLIRTLSQSKDSTRKRLVKALDEEPTRLAVGALDIVESGYGPQRHEGFQTLEESIHAYADYLRDRKIEAGGKKPLVVLVRSASFGIIGAVNARYPGLIDGIVVVGALHPDPEIGFDEGTRILNRLIEQKAFDPNLAAIEWVKQTYAEMQWHKADDPFNGTPVLSLIGSEDEEMAEATRVWFKAMDKRFDHISHVDIPGAGHDVFGSARDSGYDPVAAHIHLEQFLQQIKGPQEEIVFDWSKAPISGSEIPQTVDNFLAALQQGGFIYHEGWDYAEERAYFRLSEMSMGRNTRRLVRKKFNEGYRVTFNRNFNSVVDGCMAMEREAGNGQWLKPHVADLYRDLFKQGKAFSVEVWGPDGTLVAGSFGTILGEHVEGHSMFRDLENSYSSDSGKLIRATLNHYFASQGLEILDDEVAKEDSYKWALGVRTMPFSEFKRYIEEAQPKDRKLFSTSSSGSFVASEGNYLEAIVHDIDKMTEAGNFSYSFIQSLYGHEEASQAYGWITEIEGQGPK